MPILQDLKHWLRGIRKSKGFTLIAVLTLALGIGASTAVFSIVDAVLLHPLPFPHAERIAIPWRLAPPELKLGYEEVPWGLPDMHTLRRDLKTFEQLAALQPDAFNLTGMGEPRHLQGVRTSAAFFAVMGIAPAMGRPFTTEEDQPGREHEVVLSDRLWRDRFGADRTIVGRDITLNSSSYRVIGIMPAGFVFPRSEEMPGSFSFARETELWVPLALPGAKLHPDDPDELAIIGRLRADRTLVEAQSEMDVFKARREAEDPRTKGWYSTRVTALQRQVVGDTRGPLLAILAAVGVVLLIACSNVACLLLTRAVARRHEFALRAALGAGRARLARQVLTESLMLAALGGAAGVAIARGLIGAVKTLGPANIPRLREVTLDSTVLIFAIAVTMLCGILFGVAPAFGAARRSLSESLNAGSERGGAASNPRLRNALLVAEVALALVLTVASGLLVRTFQRLLNVDGGFQASRVITFELSLPESKFGNDKDKMARFYHAALEKLQAVGGVEAVGVGEVVPLGGAGESTGIRIPGRAPAHKGERLFANFTIISPGYLEAVGTPLLRGRAIDSSDAVDTPYVALINRSMADKYWPGENPIGKQVGPGSTRYPVSTIVGIVPNVKHLSLREEVAPEMYVPYTQRPWPAMLTMQIAMRLRGDSSRVLAAAREAVHSVDPDVPLGSVATLESIVSDSMAEARFSMLVMSAFGLLAVMLAAIGMYGVVSYSVMQRTREIGIRMALGAERRDVFKMVVGQGLRLVGLGIAIGMLCALMATRLISSQLYGVSASDPLTFAVVATGLIIVAALACFIPARRAMTVDPTVALWSE